MKKTCRVYLITNTVNGKKYVGWTDGTLQERWKEHCSLANLTNPKQLPILHKAIRKYGKAAFSMTLICEAENSEVARKKEMHFIAEYRTFYKWADAHGYNMTLGGEGAVGYRHTVEGLRKISEKSRERWSDEKWASAWRARHKQNPPIPTGTKRPDFAAKMRGRKRPGMHTSETKQRLADLLSGSFMIVLPTGERKIIRNLKKYCREHGLNDGHMHSCSRGELKGSVAKILFALFPRRSVLLEGLSIREFRENKFCLLCFRLDFRNTTTASACSLSLHSTLHAPIKPSDIFLTLSR